MTDFVAFANADDARLVLSLARRLRASGLLDNLNLPSEDRPIEQPIYVENTSGETIPPFAVMQTSSLSAGDVREVFEVEKPFDPTGSSGLLLFNGAEEIAVDGIGVAQRGPSYFHSPPQVPAAGFASYAARVDSWFLSEQRGGQFLVTARQGTDAGESHTCRVVERPAVKFIYKNLSGTLADIFWLDETATGHSGAVYDSLDVFDSGVTEGYCLLQGVDFFAVQAPCEV